MNLQRFQYKLESITLPSFLCKILILSKCFILKIIDLLNNIYSFPQFSHVVSPDGLKDRYEKEKIQFIDSSGMYLASGTKENPDTGDMCLWNGVYSAYNSKFEDNSFFNKYYKFFLRKNLKDKYHLLRGADKDSFRYDVSGDQLIGFILACNEYKKKVGYLPLDVDLFFKELSEDFKLKDELNNPTRFGMFNPNIITINGSCSVILAAMAVSGQWDKFNYLYHDCGYKYMLKYASIYLWSEEMGPKIFGKIRTGSRAWFSCNVSIISLGIIYEELILAGKFEESNYIKKCILKILNRNKYNSFFWTYIKDKGMNISIPGDAISFFNSFSKETKDDCFIPLATQESDWIWQRNPYKIQQGGPNRLDFLYVYKLLN